MVTSLISELTPLSWALLALVATFVGVSKTALPGVNTISVAVFAAILPAKASTGALLLLLILGDVFALITYRRHADWKTLIRLIPAVAAGLVFGAIFLVFADDTWVRRVIGVVLLLLIAFTLWQRTRSRGAASSESGRFALAGYGSLGGFTTMVANAGGPVMSMYFIAARFPVKAFLGTAAWFFAVINIVKLPVSIGIGIITTETLILDLFLAPAVIVGAFLGIWMANRINQKAFEWAVIALTAVGAIYLLF